MGQVRRGSAMTTFAVNVAIQRSAALQGHAQHYPESGKLRARCAVQQMQRDRPCNL